MSGVQQWRRKTAKPSHETLMAARYEPGKPLAGVIRVAKMATQGRCAVAYLPPPDGMTIAGLPDTPVLVAACVTMWGGKTGTEYAVVPGGDYLVYNADGDDLNAYAEKDLTDWYDLMEEK